MLPGRQALSAMCFVIDTLARHDKHRVTNWPSDADSSTKVMSRLQLYSQLAAAGRGAKERVASNSVCETRCMIAPAIEQTITLWLVRVPQSARLQTA